MTRSTNRLSPSLFDRSQTVRWTVRSVIGVLLLLSIGLSLPAEASEEVANGLPTVAEKTADLERRSGLLDVWVDADQAAVWLELPAPAQDAELVGEIGRYIFVEGLLSGLGSNPIGLDRGQIGDFQIVVIRRLGNKVLFEVPNLGFRALSEDPLEVAAVRESFASSVMWGTEIAALDEDGGSLVDLMPFLIRDAHDVVATLKQEEQGDFSLDSSRSAVDLSECHAFPDNLEFEALLTYGGSKPGRWVRSTVPLSTSITLTQHYSFIRLPDDGYSPREFDPRAGSFAIDFLDYAVPLDQATDRHWIVRHRLEKTDPDAEVSTVKEPLVYYLDPGTPEPVRSALIDGASWWAEAFEAAGFKDAYRVEMLPPDAHPLDVRYNVIQWVHRSTRGWSYGGGVIDPRTGEMLKGHVSLGSLRVRQDRLIFEGLVGADKTGSGGPQDPIEVALARLRQLSAHEVGHTLGLNHNFAASAYGRESVMDYPAPWVTLDEDGEIDLSDAYGVGIGKWDKFAVRYAYAQMAPGVDERAALDELVHEALNDGLIMITDEDARRADGAAPVGHLWDNGDDPVAALALSLEVRKRAIEQFGIHNLPDGQPLTRLQEVLAPIYYFHRFQLDAAAKLIGGVDYRYAIKGDGQIGAEVVEASRQRAAVDELLGIVEPSALDLPDELLTLLVPRDTSSQGSQDRWDNTPRELFAGRMGNVFDPLTAAESAAREVFRALLQPARAARLIDQHRRDADALSFDELLQVTAAAVFPSSPDSRRLSEIRRLVQWQFIDSLINLASNDLAANGVRTRVELQLDRLRTELTGNAAEATRNGPMAAAIGRFLDRPGDWSTRPATAPALPAGSPIGSGPEQPYGGFSDHAAVDGHSASCSFGSPGAR